MQPMQETTAWVLVTADGQPLTGTLAETRANAMRRCDKLYPGWRDSAYGVFTIRRVRITEVAP